ncbi:glycosyltransferase [Bacillus sp. AK128]
MKAKKVLVLSNMYPSKAAKTFGIFVKNQVQALEKRGLLVDVIAVKNPSMQKKNVIKKYIIWIIESFFNLLIKGRTYDIIHVHYVFPTGLIGLLYKKLYRKRLIVTAHGGDLDRMANKSPFIKRLTTRILIEADHIIAVGHDLSRKVQEDFGIDATKVSIINMGVNRQVFKAIDKEQAKQICHIPDQQKPILFVGNLIEQKGLLELIQAYKRVKKLEPNVSLYLLGPKKNEAFYTRIQHEISGMDDAYILDAKSQAEIANWMSASEVFVLPSYLEGFGLVALEAMSCHTPVVGSEVGGLRYLLADGAGVLIQPKNVDSLYEGLLKVLKNKDLGNQLIEEGEKRAQLNDQEHLIERVLQVYSPTGG